MEQNKAVVWQRSRQPRTRAGRARLGGCLRLGACLLLGALASPAAHASQVSYRPDSQLTGPSQLEFYRDASGSLTPEEAASGAVRFQPVRGRTANFGYSDAAYWLRLPVHSLGNSPTTVYLSIGESTLDDVRLYVFSHGILLQTGLGGDRMPASQHAVSAIHPVLPIRLQPDTDYVLYLRVAGRTATLLVPIQFQSAAGLESDVRHTLLFNGLITGIFGALFVYNLFIAASLRSQVYVYYVLFLPAAYLACTALNGFGAWKLYPHQIWPGNEGLVVFFGAAFLFNALFARALLDTAKSAPLDRPLQLLAAGSLLGLLSPWVLPLGATYPLTILLLFLTPAICSYVGIRALRRGHPQARFFLFAQWMGWVGLLAYGLTVAGVLEFSDVARQGIALGIAGDSLLLSLALASRIRRLQLAARSAEETVRRALESRREELERTVDERTRELEKARRCAEQLAVTDALTGIYNRRGLLPLLEREIARSAYEGLPFALVSLDIDHFKDINDAFGHAEGDRVLEQIVAIARETTDGAALFGRTGGEEFALAVHAQREEIRVYVEALRARIEAQLTAGPARRPVTASFGIALLNGTDRTLDALQRAADAALYRAKDRGRNRVEIYDEGPANTQRTRAIMAAGSDSPMPVLPLPFPHPR